MIEEYDVRTRLTRISRTIDRRASRMTSSVMGSALGLVAAWRAPPTWAMGITVSRRAASVGARALGSPPWSGLAGLGPRLDRSHRAPEPRARSSPPPRHGEARPRDHRRHREL